MAKKVIDGKTYNTETAEKIARYSNHLGVRDFNNLVEVLYKTKKNRYFLVGAGGAMTKYAKTIGLNSWSDSSDNFVPLSNKEASEWCEVRGIDADVIEHEFADFIEEA